MRYFLILFLVFTSCKFSKNQSENSNDIKENNDVSFFKGEKAKKRKLAQSDMSENDLSSRYRQLRNQIIGRKNSQGRWENGVSTGEDLDKLIDQTNTNYNSYPDDASKLLAAQLSFLKVYKGLIYRARPLVEDYNIIRSSLIIGLRFSGQAVQLFTPTPQWEAGFKYITEPFEFSEGKVAAIEGDETFKNYLEKEVLPQLEILKSRVEGINFDNIVWDNKVFYREANFVDSQDRFVRLGQAEKEALLSFLDSSLGAIHVLHAYKLEGLFRTIDKITKAFGMNAVFNPTDSLAENRTRIIRENLSLTLQEGEESSQSLKKAHDLFVSSVRHAKTSNRLLKERENDSFDWLLLNGQGINGFSRINNNIIANISNIALPEGNREMASAIVNGEFLEFDLKKMFVDEPPRDLKMFLPNGFDKSGRYSSKLGKRYTNFLHGRPQSWNVGYYSKYFPQVKNNDDIKRTIRIAAQSYGGAGLSMPMSLFFF